MKHTWHHSPILAQWYTEEQIDGTPDRIVWKESGAWWCKWRTSAQTSGPYTTRRAAQESR